ncbi:MAG: (Fe-S)-binding protein [Betaproteobacteria bacterium]|nr:(Fe-S)-binding protein [Betaproteobacteria bacterium]
MRVGLLVTCLVDMMRPNIGFAALDLLESAGCSVVVPEGQTCCGQPGWNSGDRESAKALSEKLIAEFADCPWVVAPSGSCAGMVRTHYPELFRDDPLMREKARALAGRTWELTDFLANVAKVHAVPGRFSGTLTYHDTCSGLRELGVKAQPRRLLAMLPGAKLQEMTGCETCCGFGGTFAVKFSEISTLMADQKCENIAASGADAVVLGDLGCMLNIEGRLRKRGDATRVLHIAEVLAGDTGDTGEASGAGR